jgi:cytochrome c-type biogenesis protein CcmE
MSMNKTAVRVGVSAAVLVSAVSLLFAITISDSSAQYYKHVDEVMADPGPWYDKPMQMHGFVVDESIEKMKDTMHYRFRIKTGEFSVAATYTGIVPDTFKDGSEVVLKGRLRPDGFHVDPNGVMAKCPSRYEASKTGGPQAGR